MARMIAMKTDKSLADAFQPVVEMSKHEDRLKRILCYDVGSGRWFRTKESIVRHAMTYVQLLHDNMIPVKQNFYFSALEIDETPAGDLYGWPARDYREPKKMIFTAEIVENFQTVNEPVLVISPNVFPEKNYNLKKNFEEEYYERN